MAGGLSRLRAVLYRQCLYSSITRQIHTSKCTRFFAYGNETSDSRQVSLVEQSRKRETLRQRDELILIASESICYPECENLMASSFGNIYAEGQPDLVLSRASPVLATDEHLFYSWHRRLSDGRFYRGCSEADRVELLAKYYIAHAFSVLKGSPAADRIFANVQALSGSPANLAIYSALLNYGDNILTLNLSHGGHLSHGSPFNVSGKLYNATQYSIDENTRLLNYDEIRRLARETKPAMIVGGASAYPWDWDWCKLREIADEVGALLHADVCHLAGLIVGGQLNNPLPFADTVMFTTHKTLMGPRGAVILSKDAAIAKKIDNAVFPGMQGGPHVNNIAGIARMFEMIVQNRDSYCQLQQRIVENSKAFAEALQQQGFDLEYNGTENHLVLLDLKNFRNRSNFRIDGETASRLLENIGIIVNKNTLPGDKTAADSSGLRVATPWLTQRGISKEQIFDLARIMKELLASSSSFNVLAPSGGERCRARVPYDQILRSRSDVLAISRALPYPKLNEAEFSDVASDPLRDAVQINNMTGLMIRSDRARLSINQSVTCNILNLRENEVASGFLLASDGKILSPVAVTNTGWSYNPSYSVIGEERVGIFVPTEKAQEVQTWLNTLSDGYVELVPDDPHMKVDGPFAVQVLREADVPSTVVSALQELVLPDVVDIDSPAVDITKPFFVGQSTLDTSKGHTLPLFEFSPEPSADLKRTVLHDWHEKHGGEMVGFGGWRMPVKYNSISEEHRAVRTAAGLFDVSHMSAVRISGTNAIPYIECTLANTASRLHVNEAQYSYMLREDGTALDDLYVYRIGREEFILVFNAANYERDIAWLNAVNNGEVCIDINQPSKRLPGSTEITPLRDASADSLINLALQGPISMDILKKLSKSDGHSHLAGGKLNDLHYLSLQGHNVIAARTGYTGETIGYELFIHPDSTNELWQLILDAGKDAGVKATGLGARDSTRIEAGLPLFGHELEGPEKLSLTDAGYGYVSRLHRPFYVGRSPYLARNYPRQKKILRLKGSGRRTAREGHAVLDSTGTPVGTITSFAFCDDDFNYYALAAVENSFNVKRGSAIRIARMTRDKVKGPVSDSKTVEMEVLTRFPTQKEKAGWSQVYSGQASDL